MSLANNGRMSAKWADSAARRRCHAKARARVIALIGLKPEGPPVPGDRPGDHLYPYTLGELLAWAREKYPARCRVAPGRTRYTVETAAFAVRGLALSDAARCLARARGLALLSRDDGTTLGGVGAFRWPPGVEPPALTEAERDALEAGR